MNGHTKTACHETVKYKKTLPASRQEEPKNLNIKNISKKRLSKY